MSCKMSERLENGVWCICGNTRLTARMLFDGNLIDGYEIISERIDIDVPEEHFFHANITEVLKIMKNRKKLTLWSNIARSV